MDFYMRLFRNSLLTSFFFCLLGFCFLNPLPPSWRVIFFCFSIGKSLLMLFSLADVACRLAVRPGRCWPFFISSNGRRPDDTPSRTMTTTTMLYTWRARVLFLASVHHADVHLSRTAPFLFRLIVVRFIFALPLKVSLPRLFRSSFTG